MLSSCQYVPYTVDGSEWRQGVSDAPAGAMSNLDLKCLLTTLMRFWVCYQPRFPRADPGPRVTNIQWLTEVCSPATLSSPTILLHIFFDMVACDV